MNQPAPPTKPRDLNALLARARDQGLRLDNLPDLPRGPDADPAPPRPLVPTPAPRPPATWPLWVLSAPLLIGALTSLTIGGFAGFLSGLGGGEFFGTLAQKAHLGGLGDALGWGLVAAAAMLTRQSGRTAEQGRERRFSRHWRLPLRTLAGLALGLGTGVTAVLGIGYSLPVGLAFGAVALFGYHLTYGLQMPRSGARLSAADKEGRAVSAALAEAESRLINIERAAASLGNPELRQRLTRIAGQGRGMLEQIAARPSDLRRARRFLTVFLEGAEQVSDGYARTHRQADSPALEQSFRNVLVNIEDQFILQRERLREADVLDLDVQIEVLKKQLEQEGIRR